MTAIDKKGTFNKIASFALQFILPFLFTIALVWFMFHEVDFRSMVAIIREGCQWRWILFAMLLSIISHIIRAARWQLQLNSLGMRPPFIAICCSIFGCYALNLVVPRLGEVWRCTYIASPRISGKNAAFSRVFGSFVADRLMDTITVLLLLFLTFLVARSAIISFMETYRIGRDILTLIASPLIWLVLVATAVIIFVIWRMIRHTHPGIRLRSLIAEIWHGFSTVKTMNGRGLFLLYSLLIWVCYFVQLYLAFFAFPFTKALCSEPGLGFGLEPCLVAFVLSSVGMAVPSNGGLGPWNIAIMFGLALFGVSEAEGYTFSIVQWSGQTIMLLLLGIFTMGYIMLHSRSRHHSKSPDKK